jgi:hypothetical protein
MRTGGCESNTLEAAANSPTKSPAKTGEAQIAFVWVVFRSPKVSGSCFVEEQPITPGGVYEGF